MNRPETAYAWSDGAAIAYQVVGSSGPDLLLIPGSVSHLEILWESPRVERFLRRLAGFSRLILMDPRGLGLSDRLTAVPTLEDRVADVMAVLDAAGSTRATLFGFADSGPQCIATAVAHSDRISGLVLHGTYAKGSRSEDYPLGWTEARDAEFHDFVHTRWGSTGNLDPTDDPAFLAWQASLMRLGASPNAVLLLHEMTKAADVRALLPRIACPALVLHRTDDPVNTVEHGRYLAEHIPGARWVELPGDEFLLWAGDTDAVADEVEELLTGQRGVAEPVRVVATVMFTDVVGSTDRAHAMGDRAWAELLATHHARVRTELRRFGGREIDTAGDGFLATFTSPTAAITCAQTLLTSVGQLGVQLRIGLHTGECEIVQDQPRGIAIHIGARVAAQAPSGEIVVSQTVRDLVAGSSLRFEDRGTHELKGVPGEWRLFAVTPPSRA